MQNNDELRQLFPDIKPMNGSPALFTLNGIGLSMYGKRDVHEETGAYLKTRCICFVFIPLIALGAYRVVDADGDGWYFLGREPLSKFAKTWNLAFVLGLCMIAGVGTYMDRVNSPSYRAQRLMAKAQRDANAGRLAAAIQHYEQAANTHSPQRARTRPAIQTIINAQLPQASAASVGRVFGYFKRQHLPRIKREQPSLYRVGQKLATKWQDKAPMVSLQVLDVLAQLAPNRKAQSGISRRQMALLEGMLKGKKSASLATRLALLYERMERCRRCFGLLKPYAKTLGTSEGARLLGEEYAKRRRYQRAHALLAPYVATHIRALHNAESRYQRAVRRVRNRTISLLKRGRGPRRFYSHTFKNLPSKTRTLQFLMYVQQQLRKSPTVAIERRKLRKASKVVPVAMGLGIVKLQLARQTRAPARRQAYLREAEKVFLSIRGIAGRSDQYKLYLGQVYYWLGQQDKGKRLFDQLLRRRKRAPQKLIQLARILREVGDQAAARRMAEEAYNKAKKPQLKYSAASLRALTSLALKEKIKWLQRSDAGSPSVKALLNSTLGNQAWQQGDPKRAAAYYRSAIKAYEAMSKHPAALNNSALAYFSLFQATGDRSAFRKGIAQIQEAAALRPSDSILLFNAADAMQRAALLDLMSKHFSPAQLKMRVKLGLLTLLYSSEAQRAPLMARLSAHPALHKARDLYRKVLLLSPNNAYAYESLGRLNNTLRDKAGMQEVMRRFAKSKIERSDSDAQTRSLYSATRAARLRRVFGKEIKQRTALIRALEKRGKRRAAGIVASRLAYTYTAYHMFGGSASAARAVKLAAQGYKASPSSFTRRSLIDTLCHKAVVELTRKDAAFRAFWRFGRRALLPRELLSLAMHESPQMRAKILAAPAFKRAASLLRTHAKVLPKRSTPMAWSLLRWIAPPLAKSRAALLQQDKANRQYHTLLYQLHPYRPSYALAQYFYAIALGQKDKAATLRARFVRQKLPIPFRENLAQKAPPARP